MRSFESLPRGSVIVIDFVEGKKTTFEEQQASQEQRDLIKKNSSVTKTGTDYNADFPTFKIAVSNMVGLNYAQASTAENASLLTSYFQNELTHMKLEFSEGQWADAESVADRKVRDIESRIRHNDQSA